MPIGGVIDSEMKKVTFPWDKGFKPEEIYQYYEEVG